MFLFYLVIGAL